MKSNIVVLYVFFLSLIVFLFAACRKSKDLMYKNDPEIYFSGSTPSAVGDSLPYTFVVRPDTVMQDTAFLYFRISGFAADKDRAVEIQVDKSTTAKAGIHFKLDPVVVKAGEYTATLPVILYRTADMKNNQFVINVKIRTSEDFDTSFGRGSYHVYVTDQLLKPGDWETFIYGTYSKVKHEFMVSRLGTTKITMSLGAQLSEMLAILQRMRLELLKYEKENGYLIDETGNRVTFPSF